MCETILKLLYSHICTHHIPYHTYTYDSISGRTIVCISKVNKHGILLRRAASIARSFSIQVFYGFWWENRERQREKEMLLGYMLSFLTNANESKFRLWAASFLVQYVHTLSQLLPGNGVWIPWTPKHFAFYEIKL